MEGRSTGIFLVSTDVEKEEDGKGDHSVSYSDAYQKERTPLIKSCVEIIRDTASRANGRHEVDHRDQSGGRSVPEISSCRLLHAVGILVCTSQQSRH